MPDALSDNRRDRRVEKTRGALSEAMFRLIKTHDWQEISVSLVCDEANVARSTFYLHYSSPTALLDEKIAAIIGQLAHGAASPLPVLEWLVDHVSENRAIFQRTVTNARTSFVFDRFKAGLVAALLSEHRAKGSSLSPLRTAMLIGGAFEALQHWAKVWRLAEVPQLKREIRRLEQLLSDRPGQ